MYVIVTYDVGEKRINKIRKLLRRYLNWVQNSVFEGELTESKFEKCIHEIRDIIDESEDSVYIYKLSYFFSDMKQIIGQDKNLTDNTIL